jgi:phosphoglycerate dehydrogenase-like enzyme
MNAPKIAIAPEGNWAPFRRKKLEEAVDSAGGVLCKPEEADGLIWIDNFNPQDLQKIMPDLRARWIQLPWAGVELFIEQGLINDKFTWTCAKGAYGPVVGEHALALLLAGFRRIYDFARKKEWVQLSDRDPKDSTSFQGDEEEGIYSLYDAHVVILGGGGIATHLVSYLQPFGTRVTVLRKHPKQMEGVERVSTLDDLHEILPTADALVLALSLTPETVGIIGKDELKLMKKTALIVNVSRGKQIDTDALVTALQNNWIGTAALDVTDPEPLPKGHILWDLPNALITPHTADNALWVSHDFAHRVHENVKRFALGQPLIGLVDPKLGY